MARWFNPLALCLALLLLLGGALAKGKPSLRRGPDMEEEIRRATLLDTTITGVPFGGSTSLEFAPVRPPQNSPNSTRVSFSFNDTTPASCAATINGQCSRWNWANHTWPAPATTALVPASTQPPWVANMSYVPNFVCYTGFLSFYSATVSQFSDPIPTGNIVTRVRPLICILALPSLAPQLLT